LRLALDPSTPTVIAFQLLTVVPFPGEGSTRRRSE
jgi:hypothetical protein